MARNAQLRSQSRYSSNRQYAGESRSEQLSDNRSRFSDSKGNIKLSFKQIVVFWSGNIILLLLAFYVGFIAGKREGAIAVLDQAGEQMVRLELHTPVEPYPLASEVDTTTPTEKTTSKLENLPENDNIKTKIQDQNKIDFTSTTSLPTQAPKEKVIEPTLDKEEKKLVKEEADEEVYPGKNIFGPPPVKSAESKKEFAPIEFKNEKSKPTVNSLVPSKGWYVQIAAAPNDAKALEYYNRMAAKGLKVSLEPAAIRDRSFYRVLIGPFSSQADAVAKRSDLKQRTGVEGEPFIRHVQ